MTLVFDALQQHFQRDHALFSPHSVAIEHSDNGLIGHFAHLKLHSHYQPLLDAKRLNTVAFEALLRPINMETLSPLPPYAAFECVNSPQQAIYLDRLCRALHAANFVRQDTQGKDLFLNVSGGHLIAVSQGHGQAFEELLNFCGMTPKQVVLEILESSVDQLELLQEAVAAYKKRGFRIAMDDFGSSHSNFDRLWHLTPDVVKLDRGLIEQAQTNPRARIILPKLIEIIHDLGAHAVCEGIETRAQHQLCVDAGADLLQGYYYARPAAHLQQEFPHLKG